MVLFVCGWAEQWLERKSQLVITIYNQVSCLSPNCHPDLPSLHGTWSWLSLCALSLALGALLGHSPHPSLLCAWHCSLSSPWFSTLLEPLSCLCDLPCPAGMQF